MENLIFKVEIYLLNTQIIDRLLFFAHFDLLSGMLHPKLELPQPPKFKYHLVFYLIWRQNVAGKQTW